VTKTDGQLLQQHDKLVGKLPRYNVVCMACDQVYQPLIKSPLWWRAKKRADEGYLDALHVSGEDCGCVSKIHKPNAPYRICGYDDMCCDYNIPCKTFVQAVTLYRERSRWGDVVFIHSVSGSVEEKLRWS